MELMLQHKHLLIKLYLPDGKYRYDVFSALVVGDDSFTITGFGGNNTSANYIAPKSDVHNDMHAQMAGIAANWSYGMLVYRPERICSLKFNVNKKSCDSFSLITG